MKHLFRFFALFLVVFVLGSCNEQQKPMPNFEIEHTLEYDAILIIESSPSFVQLRINETTKAFDKFPVKISILQGEQFFLSVPRTAVYHFKKIEYQNRNLPASYRQKPEPMNL